MPDGSLPPSNAKMALLHGADTDVAPFASYAINGGHFSVTLTQIDMAGINIYPWIDCNNNGIFDYLNDAWGMSIYVQYDFINNLWIIGSNSYTNGSTVTTNANFIFSCP
jgi:hypothetical protein